jgi:hypothetical protein
MGAHEYNKKGTVKTVPQLTIKQLTIKQISFKGGYLNSTKRQ